FQAEDGIRDFHVTGVQTCALPISDQQLNTWIRPLQAEEADGCLRLLAPNRFVLDWVREHFADRIRELLASLQPDNPPELILEVEIGRASCRERVCISAGDGY